MEQIALIYGSVFVYWSHILLALGIAVGICLYLALYLSKPGTGMAAMLSVPLALGLSLVLGRLLHWYCRPDQYESLTAAMLDPASGGFALAGAFAGCVPAACLLRLVRLSKNLPHMLDCMAIAGSAAITVGRLSGFFSAADRGMVVTTLQGLPWAWPVTNPVSGTEELRLATFFLQALTAAGLCLMLLIFWLVSSRRQTLRHGDVSLIFLLCYGASQVLLDSTRYDSLYFRSNGFVSIVQVLGACGLGLTAVLFSVRLVRSRGWKKWYLLLWTGLAGLIGLGGYMEYFVQRYSQKVVFGYSIMTAALAGIVVLTLAIRHLAVSAERKQQLRSAWTQQGVSDGNYDSE